MRDNHHHLRNQKLHPSLKGLTLCLLDSTNPITKILDITNETVLEREVELICMTNSFEVRLNN